MKLQELRDEYVESRFGPLLLKAVREMCRQVSRHHPPRVYMDAPTLEEGLDDFVQSFVCEVLLGENQIDFLMDMSETIEDFERLIQRQIRRFLARQRQRTVVDNLIDRCKEIAKEDPFEIHEENGGWAFSVRGSLKSTRPADSEQVRAIGVEISMFPIVRSDTNERAPIVYARETLRAILEKIGQKLQCQIAVSDLDLIFREALTFLIPRRLDTDEGVQAAAASVTLGPEMELVVKECAESMLRALNREERVILRMKMEGESDARIADVLGISRPTVDKRKRKMLAKAAFVLENLDEQLQREVMDHVFMNMSLGGSSDG